MFGLRQKLGLGFGGLLLILLLVSGIGIAVLRQHRSALDKFLYENWRSVEYGQRMIDALDRLDDAMKAIVADPKAPAATKAIAAATKDFDDNLSAENHNITLPGEDRLAQALSDAWMGASGYRTLLNRLLSPQTSAADGAALQKQLEALSPKVKAAARAVIQLNLDNMKPIDGQVKAMADSTSRLMMILAAVGATLAIAFVALMSRSILQPVLALTRSAREIEEGNLDLVVQIQSRDELRQLAEAFNSMAAKLREYRRTNRAKLVRTQQTTQNAINSLPDAVAILSPDGHVEMANAAARQMFALREGAHVSELRAEWLKDLYDRITREQRAIEPRGYESAIQVLDERGGERFFLPRAVPISDADHQLMGVTVVLADVTNLRRLDEMKSGMLSVVSHELKTPLTSIRMGVHLLLEERIGSLTPEQNEILVAVSEDSERLNRIVENLLDMSRIESGRALMELRPQQPEQMMSTAIEPVEAGFHDKGVELSVEVAPETPSVMADPTRIGHVFSNLLLNALRFTPPGGQVKVTAAPDGAMVRFAVIDTGPGIAAQYKDKIFERFFRVPGQASSTGAGLGLAIAREIVEAHGGQIKVESSEGQGSTFSFTLAPAPSDAPSAGGNGRLVEHEATIT